MNENSIYATVWKNLKGIKLNNTSQRESGECSMLFCVRYLGYKSISTHTCMCVYTHAHMYTNVCELTHAHAHTMHAHKHACMHTHTHMHAHTHTCTYWHMYRRVCMCGVYLCTHTYTCMHAYICVCTHMHMYACAHTHTCMHTYTHRHAHIQTQSFHKAEWGKQKWSSDRQTSVWEGEKWRLHSDIYALTSAELYITVLIMTHLTTWWNCQN